jgi:hypothetical protein
MPPRRVKATLPPRCPLRAPSRISPESWSPARRQLAPSGASAIRLCRYSGLNGQPRLTLIRSITIDAASVVGELVRELDRLPSDHGVMACPADDGSEILALLAYPGDHAVTISVGLRGCETVTNGSVNRVALGLGSPPAFGPQLVSQLEHLTSPVGRRRSRRPLW